MKIQTKNLALAVALALGSLAGAAQAALVTTSRTWDLSNGQAGNNGPLNGGPVSVASGDHVVYTVDFTGNQVLTIADGHELLWTALEAGDNNSSYTIQNVHLDFLGATAVGGAATSLFKSIESGGMAHLGTAWQQFLNPGQSISFSSFQLSFDVLSIAVSPHGYARSLDYASGDHVSFSVNTVPEGGSIGLVAAALAMLTGVRRARQRRA
ncbi:hypothetical protein ACS5PN_24750 [Roseateles sp. NT4]|uniref:hypothetical protein n=1 Tax=Roseateles sp. NT4 TaxID=3453715 RepID=UPI003EE92C44